MQKGESFQVVEDHTQDVDVVSNKARGRYEPCERCFSFVIVEGVKSYCVDCGWNETEKGKPRVEHDFFEDDGVTTDVVRHAMAKAWMPEKLREMKDKGKGNWKGDVNTNTHDGGTRSGNSASAAAQPPRSRCGGPVDGAAQPSGPSGPQTSSSSSSSRWQGGAGEAWQHGAGYSLRGGDSRKDWDGDF